MRLAVFCFLFAALVAGAGFAQPTTNVLDGGDVGAAVAFNEILFDTNGGGGGFDTDGNGIVEVDDEFIEIINIGTVAADISSWELWDESFGSMYFQFPGAVNSGTTMLQPGAVAAVCIFIDAGGSLPSVTGNNLIFDAGIDTGTFGKFSNGGENSAMINDLNNYIQFGWNGDGEVDFTTDGDTTARFTGATRIGAYEMWPTNLDLGSSQGRLPDGDINIADFSTYATLPNGKASPGALNNTVPVELSVFGSN